MIKKFVILFKLGRKVANSDILNIISKFKEPPLAIKILFKILMEVIYTIHNNFDHCYADFLGEKLSEINITSPTGLPQYKKLSGINLAEQFWNNLLN